MAVSKAAVRISDSEERTAGGDKINAGFLEGLIGYQLRRAQTVLFQDFTLALGEKQITPGQFGLLVKIKHNQGISQTGLAKAVGVERSTLGETIDRFEKRNLVERRKHETDRRAYALFLTAEGEQFLESIMPIVFAHEKKVARFFTEPEKAVLLELLRKLADQ